MDINRTRRWSVSGVIHLSDTKERYVTAQGPAPRIYEALGFARSAIAMKFPDEPIDTLELFQCIGGELMEDEEWFVTNGFTREDL